MRVRLTRLAWAAAVAAVAVTVAAVAALRGSSRSPNGSRRTPPKPMIAVADIRVVNADTAAAWLAYGLPQMITAKLSRIPEVDVVAPSQVREMRATAGAPPRPLSAAEAVQLGRRLGATLVVTGGVLHTDTATMLDLSTYDVATGRLVRVEAVTGTNVVLIAEEVAVRLLALVGASGPGPRLEEVETRSVEAYRHFIRHAQLGSEGRTEEAVRELDAAIALDSSFISAVHTRAVLAFHRNETEVLARLNAVFERHRARATEFDRLERESFLAEHRGDHARAEGMAELLVRRYPRDPRGYGRLIDVYGRLGRWADAERLAERLLALDSLGAARARGPCTACFGYGSLMGYGSLIGARLFQGKWAEAERAARRLVALQPDVPGAYANLAWVLAFRQRYDEALAAQRRALALEGRDASIDYGRLLLMARHLDKVDSLVAAWLASGRRPLREQALDLRAMLERERGQFRAAIATLDSLAREFPAGGVLFILRAHTIARLGDYDRAERLFEELTHGKPDIPAASRTGGAARVYAWHHALLADAVAPARDTVWLRALADSIEMVGRRSYYPRDWRVHHHVRGLLAMKAGRYEEAIREFEAARYGAVNMWTRSLAEAGRAAMLLGRPEDAIAFLRDAYRAVPDAMGRYQPRSELDYLMALAFRQAHMPDSAAVYATYARRAWTAPDPEVRRLVAQLP